MTSKTMNREEVYQQLTGIFREVFDDEHIVLSETTTARDIAGWDSVNHINLVIAVEMRFGVEFNTEEVARMENVSEFVNAILKKSA